MTPRSVPGNGGLAVVTGAGGGIGAAVARRLDARGYRLLLVDVDETSSRALAAELTTAEVLIADLGDRRQVRELSDRIIGELEPVGIAFINAGVMVPGDLTELRSDAIDMQLDVNLTSSVYLIRACAMNMADHGGGHIVATVSMGGVLSLRGSAVYSASKFGLRGLLAGLRDELAPKGIAVSGIYPTGVDTPMLRKEARGAGSALNFLSRPRTVDDVADGFEKALRTRQLEVFVPFSDSILPRLVSLAPAAMTHLYPLLELIGERGRRTFLRSIETDEPAAPASGPQSPSSGRRP